MLLRRSKLLNDNYKQVTYIQTNSSTETSYAYFNSFIKSTGKERIIITLSVHSNVEVGLFGARGHMDSYIWFSNQFFFFRYNNKYENVSNIWKVVLNEINTIDMNRNIVTMKNGTVTITEESSWTGTRSIGIGAVLTDNDLPFTYLMPNIRIYGCKIYSNNKLVRNFIPAKFNFGYGLFDKVYHKIYKPIGSAIVTGGY